MSEQTPLARIPTLENASCRTEQLAHSSARLKFVVQANWRRAEKGDKMHKAFLAAGLACAVMAPASAQTAYTYEYDIFGRLVRLERSTGPSSRVRYTFDTVDNRTRVKQGVSTPVANNDGALVETTFGPWNLYPQGNDTDADFPFDSLTITNLTGTGSGYASIAPGGAYIYIYGIPDGSYSWTYTIQDADGNTDSATLDLEAFHISCGPVECS